MYQEFLLEEQKVNFHFFFPLAQNINLKGVFIPHAIFCNSSRQHRVITNCVSIPDVENNESDFPADFWKGKY